jgi:glycosyltransferase involved in cell wall biosynthesis
MALKPPPAVTVSVVVPVYNEISTVRAALDALVEKRVPGYEFQLIIVESNSSDGSREVVLGYRGVPSVTVILEPTAKGKGHAVRAGLLAATGEIIMIQDADLEYDLADYERLLTPITAGETAFVLGTRHSKKGWAIRKFTDQKVQAAVLNLAHWTFTLMINASLGLWLSDPFTMYKVFRRDCIRDLTFECNRFDFDWELLIKLVRKGYRPVEIPVSYRSRSFKAGKKVAMFRDPVTWMVALVKYRFQPL